MKLPLIVKTLNGAIYHVLQFDRGYAIAVNPRTLRVEELILGEIAVLSEAEYAKWKSRPEDLIYDTRPIKNTRLNPNQEN